MTASHLALAATLMASNPVKVPLQPVMLVPHAWHQQMFEAETLDHQLLPCMGHQHHWLRTNLDEHSMGVIGFTSRCPRWLIMLNDFKGR